VNEIGDLFELGALVHPEEYHQPDEALNDDNGTEESGGG
jgi:hypothetical protein